ncbi:MAG: HAD family hydrolase [Lentisphaeria bacterium]|nr:HAD family hydrolase [Lentisphaeria bacterium]
MMKFKALLFDINGTVCNILTSEDDENLYRVTANYLWYRGVKILPGELKKRYLELNRQQRKESPETYPEFDVVKIFQVLIEQYRGSVRASHTLAVAAATLFRAASLFRLELYEGVNEVLSVMKRHYRLGAVSDGQSLWAAPEMKMTGLNRFFEFSVVSGDYGFRKPDSRMFELALTRLRLDKSEVIYVGNDMYRDIWGACNAGLKTIFFKSNQGEHAFAGADPDYIIYNFNELPQAVEFLENKGT